MKRTKKPARADAILTADWHLREDTPVCRADNFPEAQWRKVDFVRQLQEQHQCPVLHAGDLFHHWKPSPRLLSQCLEHLPNQFHTVYGNHDLPQHNLDLAEKSGVHTLAVAGRLTILPHGHWANLPKKDPSIVLKGRKVAVWHVMTYAGKPPWPGCKATPGHLLLRKYSAYDLILTGDNHQRFTSRMDGRQLVNPGNLTRQAASDESPAVFLWYAQNNDVKQVDLPHDPEAVTREHLDRVEERDTRISAFIERLNDNWTPDLNFRNNLKQFELSNKVPHSVMNIVYRAMEEV